MFTKRKLKCSKIQKKQGFCRTPSRSFSETLPFFTYILLMYLYQPPECFYLPLKYFVQKTFLFLKRKFKLQAAFQLIAHPDGSAM